MKAIELHRYLRSLCVFDKARWVDEILFGDPETEIRKIGTCWMPYLDTLQAAHAAGVNVLVCHEPLLYCHWGWDDPDNDVKRICAEGGFPHALAAYQQAVDKKREWLRQRGMVVIRCHDVLDRAPGFGIPIGFARLLGYPEERLLRATDYLRLYAVSPVPARDEARRIAACLRPLGQDSVMFYGDGERVIQSVAIGTGCCSDPLAFMELGGDLCVTINDTLRTWIQGEYARDTGYPTVVVDHGASEEGGVRLLCDKLQAELGLPCQHFPQGAGYQTIRAE